MLDSWEVLISPSHCSTLHTCYYSVRWPQLYFSMNYSTFACIYMPFFPFFVANFGNFLPPQPAFPPNYLSMLVENPTFLLFGNSHARATILTYHSSWKPVEKKGSAWRTSCGISQTRQQQQKIKVRIEYVIASTFPCITYNT